jgi:hypothetical protein
MSGGAAAGGAGFTNQTAAAANAAAVITLASGIGLLWPRAAVLASRLLPGSFLVWLLLVRLPVVFRAPTVTGAWWELGDTAVMAAASWVLVVWFAGDRDRQRLGFATSGNGLRIARALYGLGLIPFGAHFTYVARTVSLVPGWLPWHGPPRTSPALPSSRRAWRCSSACAHGWRPRSRRCSWASSRCWCGCRSSWRGPDASQWTEFVSPWALTAGAWMVPDSYRGIPWLAVGKR